MSFSTPVDWQVFLALLSFPATPFTAPACWTVCAIWTVCRVTYRAVGDAKGWSLPYFSPRWVALSAARLWCTRFRCKCCTLIRLNSDQEWQFYLWTKSRPWTNCLWDQQATGRTLPWAPWPSYTVYQRSGWTFSFDAFFTDRFQRTLWPDTLLQSPFAWPTALNFPSWSLNSSDRPKYAAGVQSEWAHEGCWDCSCWKMSGFWVFGFRLRKCCWTFCWTGKTIRPIDAESLWSAALCMRLWFIINVPVRCAIASCGYCYHGSAVLCMRFRFIINVPVRCVIARCAIASCSYCFRWTSDCLTACYPHSHNFTNPAMLEISPASPSMTPVPWTTSSP
jgi:hypothetical protein